MLSFRLTRKGISRFVHAKRAVMILRTMPRQIYNFRARQKPQEANGAPHLRQLQEYLPYNSTRKPLRGL